MLVLSRKAGQRIIIGSGIEVVVTQIRGDKVQLGFIAPDGVPIHREEVYRRIEAEQRSDMEAAQPSDGPLYAELALDR